MITEYDIQRRSNCFYLQQLKSEIKLRVLRNHLREDCSVQLSLDFPANGSTILDKIIELKNHFLLLDIYDIVFTQGHAYQDVYPLLVEILKDLSLTNQFTPWVNDPGTMMVTALNEHNKFATQEFEDCAVLLN